MSSTCRINASIIGLFSLDNKKEKSFFEEIIVIACVCAVFVVSLQRIQELYAKVCKRNSSAEVLR